MKTVFTDAFIKNIKQAGRFTDAATSGLNFNVKSNGGGYWVFRYLFGGKRLDLSLGAYPAITLKEARKRAIAARNDLLQGIKPKIKTFYREYSIEVMGGIVILSDIILERFY
jgi:hypothetical protein